ncbi:MAG: substrate-binding domain-containing protein, partial [Firmicutes bacterium]|nr:substrate-binding domain-containing protein [Bacillota bacterium]
NNMVSNLSLDSLRNIFKKKIKNWSEIVPKFDVPITVIGREEASGTREGFEKISGDSQYDIILPESGDISAKVSNEDGAIGYISLPSVSNKVQKVNINDVECNPKNIKNGEYAISRPFIQIYEENLENEILNKWLEFLKSEDAKKIIESERLISIS